VAKKAKLSSDATNWFAVAQQIYGSEAGDVNLAQRMAEKLKAANQGVNRFYRGMKINRPDFDKNVYMSKGFLDSGGPGGPKGKGGLPEKGAGPENKPGPDSLDTKSKYGIAQKPQAITGGGLAVVAEEARQNKPVTHLSQAAQDLLPTSRDPRFARPKVAQPLSDAEKAKREAAERRRRGRGGRVAPAPTPPAQAVAPTLPARTQREEKLSRFLQMEAPIEPGLTGLRSDPGAVVPIGREILAAYNLAQAAPPPPLADKPPGMSLAAWNTAKDIEARKSGELRYPGAPTGEAVADAYTNIAEYAMELSETLLRNASQFGQELLTLGSMSSANIMMNELIADRATADVAGGQLEQDRTDRYFDLGRLPASGLYEYDKVVGKVVPIDGYQEEAEAPVAGTEYTLTQMIENFTTSLDERSSASEISEGISKALTTHVTGIDPDAPVPADSFIESASGLATLLPTSPQHPDYQAPDLASLQNLVTMDDVAGMTQEERDALESQVDVGTGTLGQQIKERLENSGLDFDMDPEAFFELYLMLDQMGLITEEERNYLIDIGKIIPPIGGLTTSSYGGSSGYGYGGGGSYGYRSPGAYNPFGGSGAAGASPYSDQRRKVTQLMGAQWSF